MRVLPVAAIVAAVSNIALTQIASAADQGPPAHKAPVYRAPPPPRAPVYNWTGFYVGGNVGGSWGNARTDIAGSATTVSTIGPFPPATFADSQTQRLNGFIDGGQIGYNIQFVPRWVLGFEADIQGSGKRAINAFADPFSSAQCITPSCNNNGFVTITGTAVTPYDAKIGWFGTARGRLAALIGDQVLLYGTALLMVMSNCRGLPMLMGQQPAGSSPPPSSQPPRQHSASPGPRLAMRLAVGSRARIGCRQAGRGRWNIST
jgi:outer membrane immunogenic protein